MWHIRGLTKWRLFDYDGWPKLIQDLFPGLPGKIDSAFLHDDQYFFTKVIFDKNKINCLRNFKNSKQQT